MSLQFHFLLFILLFSSFNQLHDLSSQDVFSFKYSLTLNLKADLELVVGPFTRNYSFNGSSMFITNLEFKRYNNTCYYAKYTMVGSLNLPIPEELLKIIGPDNIFGLLNSPLYRSNSTLVCSINEELSRILTSDLTSFTMNGNFSGFDSRYNSSLTYRGITQYKDIQVVNLLFSYNFTAKSEQQMHDLRSNNTIYLSIVDNIPVYMNGDSVYMLKNKPSGFRFEPTIQEAKIIMNLQSELIQTDYKRIYYGGKVNALSFNTNLGVFILVLSNATISDVTVLGDTLHLKSSKEKNAFIYLLYGKQKLFIDFNKVRIKANNESLSFIPVYFLDYLALFSNYGSNDEIEINLGANVGVYEYRASTATVARIENQLTLFYILLAVVIISTLIILMMRLKRA